MVDAHARAGRINGLQKAVRFRRAPGTVRSDRHLAWILAGAGVYAVAMGFPLLLRQVPSFVYAIAILGTLLLLVGLHLRWTAGSPEP